MLRPYFTIVIPTYNRAHRIRKTIDSVLMQTFHDFELIVVDDGSTDNTAEIVNGVNDRRITLLSTTNRERAAARNTGISRSTGEYITFLDSDDLLYPEHLSEAHKALEVRRSEVYHQAYEVKTERGTVISTAVLSGSHPINELLFTTGNVMSCMGVFIRNDVAKANRFDETRSLSGVEDWELWIRLAAQYDIHHGTTVTAALIQHEGRSVEEVSAVRWIERMETFMKVVEQNDAVRKRYASLLPILRANAMTYLSLHFSESAGLKKQSFRFLFSGLKESSRVIFKRRTFAILRNLLFR